MAKTVADLLLERLIGWGVKTIFSLPGDGINGIFEALRTHRNQIKYVQVRHEEAAAFAACGYAKYAGGLGVCMATSGPGGIHLLNGLYDAKFDGQPVLAITGHIFHDLIGTHFQQDLDLDKLYADVAAYSERIMGPAHVNNVVDNAIKTALSQRTVAHITVPKDIQEWDGANGERSEMNVSNHTADVYAPALPLPTREELQSAADIINQGKKVAILVGRGCLGAREEVQRLAEQVAGSVTTALLGKGVIPDDSPYNTGCLGLLGSGPSSEAMQGCDTLIILGSSFPYHQFLPKPEQARCVQVDIDSTRIGLRYPVEAGLVGSCQRVLQALLPLIRRKSDRGFQEMIQQNVKHWNEVIRQRANRMDKPIKPQLIAERLNKYFADDAIICCDTGTVTTWAARYFRMRGRMQFSASGRLATMGNGLPYAVGAAIAFPGRQVVAFCGDGGFNHDDGRNGHSGEVPAAGQGDHHQEQCPGTDQVGADCHRR